MPLKENIRFSVGVYQGTCEKVKVITVAVRKWKWSRHLWEAHHKDDEYCEETRQILCEHSGEVFGFEIQKTTSFIFTVKIMYFISLWFSFENDNEGCDYECSWLPYDDHDDHNSHVCTCISWWPLAPQDESHDRRRESMDHGKASLGKKRWSFISNQIRDHDLL